MLFIFFRSDESLRRALRAAIFSHRSAALRGILQARGSRAFARGLGRFSGRVMADALSQLSPTQRQSVMRHFTFLQRKRIRAALGKPPTCKYVPDFVCAKTLESAYHVQYTSARFKLRALRNTKTQFRLK